MNKPHLKQILEKYIPHRTGLPIKIIYPMGPPGAGIHLLFCIARVYSIRQDLRAKMVACFWNLLLPGRRTFLSFNELPEQVAVGPISSISLMVGSNCRCIVGRRSGEVQTESAAPTGTYVALFASSLILLSLWVTSSSTKYSARLQGRVVPVPRWQPSCRKYLAWKVVAVISLRGSGHW